MDNDDDVLGRLDALLNRDKAHRDVQAVPATPPAETISSVLDVPLLTEIYQPEVVSRDDDVMVRGVVEQQPAPEGAYLLVQEAVPMMVNVIDEVLTSYAKPAMEETMQRVLAEMQPKIEALMRQRLHETLAQLGKN